MGLGFPGGPALDKAARDPGTGPQPGFPSALMKDKSLDFSYSGLKTSVLYYVEGLKREGKSPDVPAVAAAFQQAAVSPLIKRLLEAARQTGYTRIVVGGGVAANSLLRKELPARAAAEGLEVFVPSMALCVDNAAMIAYAGGLRLGAGERGNWEQGVEPNLTY